jgi:hypothetical protein
MARDFADDGVRSHHATAREPVVVLKRHMHHAMQHRCSPTPFSRGANYRTNRSHLTELISKSGVIGFTPFSSAAAKPEYSVIPKASSQVRSSE